MTNSDFGTPHEAVLRQVDGAGLVMADASLCLDTHSCDVAAVDYYNQMTQACRSVTDASEAQFGPLTTSANNDTAY